MSETPAVALLMPKSKNPAIVLEACIKDEQGKGKGVTFASVGRLGERGVTFAWHDF